MIDTGDGDETVKIRESQTIRMRKRIGPGPVDDTQARTSCKWRKVQIEWEEALFIIKRRYGRGDETRR